MNETFGQFLKRLRQRENGMSQESLAERIGRVKMTVSQYERDACAPPQGDVLEAIVEALDLSDDEASQLKLLASRKRNTIPDDISEYFFKNPIVYEAIRTAKKRDVGNEQWGYFIASIEGDNEFKNI